MKIMVKLTVLLATLLLLAGVSFANNCYCYEITYTPLDFPATIETIFQEICFDYGDNVGSVNGMCGPCDWYDPLYMFFDVRKRAIMYSDEFGTCSASLEFHGGINGVTGIYDNISGMTRWEFRGHRVDMENCECMGG